MKYCIGDTVVCINVEEQNLHSNFQAFRCDESEEPQLTIDIVEEPEMTMNIQMTVGQIMLMESEEIGVFEGAMGIDLLYPKNVQLTSIAIAKGYRSAKVYVVQDAEGKWKEELFLALRDVIYLAVSYTHLRAHETRRYIVFRLLLEYWIPRRCLLMDAV